MSEGRAKRSRTEEEEPEATGECVKMEEDPKPVTYDVVFRSYVPRDEKLRACRREQTAVPDMVANIAERVVSLTQRREQEDIVSLAPKKAAWDLQRDLQPKLETLSRRTDRAILQILKTNAAAN